MCIAMPFLTCSHREVGLKEADFWEQCKDLAAKTMMAIQPSLAMQYRCHFPRKRRRAGQVRV